MYATMSGDNIEIYSDSFSFVPGGEESGGTITLTGTGGNIATSTSGGGVQVRSGVQAQEKGVLTFSLSTSALSIGTLSTTNVAVSYVTTTISTDSETGYSLSVSEDGNLRSGANDIDDVGDGAVTAGSEEYGIETSGADGLLSTDTAINNSVLIASANGRITARETAVIFHTAISSATPDGTYSHTVTFTSTVNP
jgi:hypothetical protein